MPLFYFTRKSDNRNEYYFAQMQRTESIGKGERSSSEKGGKSSITSDAFLSNYENLDDIIKACLDYCSVITFRYHVNKEKICRLLSAANIIPEKPGEIIEKIVEELICSQMLESDVFDVSEVKVSELYNELFLVEVNEQDFIDKITGSPVYAVIEDDGKNIPPDFKNLQIHSLFLITAERRGSSVDSDQGLSITYNRTLCKLQSLLVLDLDGKLECLPDEVEDLVHLKYLGLHCSYLDSLPKTIGNLQELQTFDMRLSHFEHTLPIEMLNLQQLRHLLVSHCTNNCEVRVPMGFGKMANLKTCDGVYAGDGAANELSALTRLKKVGFKRVSNDHANELFAAIEKMTELVSLSLEAEGSLFDGTDLLPDMKELSPPPLLQKLHLTGKLVEIPRWLASMENLTTLYFSFSKLMNNSTSVLQSLRMLKHLTLWNAYTAEYIGQEFCEPGGFSKLETLTIASDVLMEWSEIVEGAFPSLKRLCLHNCMNLRSLPEGFQNISTLEVLVLFPAYNDIISRLGGEENYKIKNIPRFIFYEFPQLID